MHLRLSNESEMHFSIFREFLMAVDISAHENSHEKNKSLKPCGLRLSRVRESNPPLQLGKLTYYRCTNPANICAFIIVTHYLIVVKMWYNFKSV